jgi:Domain of unknown function (DUF397)
MPSIHPAGWLIASACHQGSCVQVARVDDSVALRNSKDPDGPVLLYSSEEWRAFIDGTKVGEFDDLT